MQTGRFTRWKPDSPAAAWYFFFCTEKDPEIFHLAGGDIPFQGSDRVRRLL
jgi:hypothetical protein